MIVINDDSPLKIATEKNLLQSNDEEALKGIVEKIIKENMGNIVIKGPELFDEFKKNGKISYAFRLVFQSHERTLTDVEVNDIMTKITNKIKEKNAWQVR